MSVMSAAHEARCPVQVWGSGVGVPQLHRPSVVAEPLRAKVLDVGAWLAGDRLRGRRVTLFGGSVEATSPSLTRARAMGLPGAWVSR